MILLYNTDGEERKHILHQSTIQEHSPVKWKMQIHLTFLPEVIQTQL